MEERAATSFDADRQCRVVAIVASAGGHAAVSAVLRSLPEPFTVPLIVMQHLGPSSTETPSLYSRQTPMRVETLDAGTVLQPGTVYVVPPRVFVELMPDGTSALKPCERGAIDKPLDRFLDSVARSFGRHAIGVVLTGMGNDGAAGARHLHDVQGRVLVQSEDSAEHPGMPRAAIDAGAADLVVPLSDLGLVIAEVASGTPRRKAASELRAIARVFGESSEVAARAREVDWSRTPLGSALNWPRDLRLMTRAVADNPFPVAVWWGPGLIQIYNDPWARFLGTAKHPAALGGPARDTWPEIWHIIGPMLDRVTTTGEPSGEENFPIYLDRGGVLEEVFATFAYSPLRDPATGAIAGVLNTAMDTTATVIAERRMRALRDLASTLTGASTAREACERAAAALAQDASDLSFVLLYQLDELRRQATLAGAAGLAPGASAAPRLVDLQAADAEGRWPLQRALDWPLLLHDLRSRFPHLQQDPPAATGIPPARSAMLLPLRLSAHKAATAVLVAGLNPHRPLDDDFRTFLDLAAQQINAGLVDARARQIERERTERLAQLDQAKTEFFANVSHEFRTPLTLLLPPLEELLARRDLLPPVLLKDVDVAVRNARRLLGLVNDLLDFSHIEQRRQRVAVEPVDLAAATADVASEFRSAIEAGGLQFRVECDAGLPPVPVNREMWEKVVSNLLANAFKFTFQGGISVTLRALSLHAELEVADSGVGIPAAELSNIFKRFHRVRGTRARTVEGSGIGLAMVEDLVTRMGGQIRVRSREGQGTTFTVWMPYQAHGRLLQVAAPVESRSAAGGRAAADLARQAARWVADADDAARLEGVIDDLLGSRTPAQPAPSPVARPARGSIVVADDNADLRDYLRRLLAPYWDVEVAADGRAALDLVRRHRPDLVLADVMMPGTDGFALLRAIREDPALRHTPVVLVTARAGEEAAIEGLLAGADDYIAKPFSPRELIARVRAVVDRGRAEAAARKATEAQLRESEQRQAFLLKLSDAMRRLADPVEVQAEACRLIGEHLAAARAYCAGIDEARGVVEVRRDYRRGDSPSMAGVYRLVDHGWSLPILRAGRTIVFADVDRTELVPEADRPALRKIGIVAHVAVPVLKAGRLVGCFCVSEPAPREWRGDEVELIRETGERTWAAVDVAKAEAAVRAGENLLRRAISVPRVGVLFFRLDGTIADANEAFQRMCGYSLHELRTTAHWDVLTAPEFLPVTAERARDLAERGETVPYEKRMVRKDGSAWWGLFAPTRLSGDGHASECVEFVFDVTEAKQAQEALRRSEQRLRAFVTASWDVVYRLNADWTHVERLYGDELAADEGGAPSSWLERVVPPEDRHGLRTAIEHAVARGEMFQLEHPVRSDGDAPGWGVSRAVPVRNARGEVVEWLATTRATALASSA